VESIDAVGTFAAFGAFAGALAAYLSLSLERATEWAMHGMVVGGVTGLLILFLRLLH